MLLLFYELELVDTNQYENEGSIQHDNSNVLYPVSSTIYHH